MLKREMQERIEALKPKRSMTDAQATEEVYEHRENSLPRSINEQLLCKRERARRWSKGGGGSSPQVDVDERTGFKTIQGWSGDEESEYRSVSTRATLRAEIIKQAVLQEE